MGNCCSTIDQAETSNRKEEKMKRKYTSDKATQAVDHNESRLLQSPGTADMMMVSDDRVEGVDFERLAVVLKDKMLPMLPLRRLVIASKVCREWNHNASYLLERRGFDLNPPSDVNLDGPYPITHPSLFGTNSTGIMGFVGRGLRSLGEEGDDGRRWSLTTATGCIRIFDSSDRSTQPKDDTGVHKFNNDLPNILATNGRMCFVERPYWQYHMMYNRRGGGQQQDLWLAVDLGPCLRLRPTAYAMRHYSRQNRANRNWMLQGSNDYGEEEREEWHTIDNRINDESLSTVTGSVAVYSISNDTDSVPMMREGFRFFRIVKTGPDAALDSLHYLPYLAWNCTGKSFWWAAPPQPTGKQRPGLNRVGQSKQAIITFLLLQKLQKKRRGQKCLVMSNQ